MKRNDIPKHHHEVVITDETKRRIKFLASYFGRPQGDVIKDSIDSVFEQVERLIKGGADNGNITKE